MAFSVLGSFAFRRLARSTVANNLGVNPSSPLLRLQQQHFGPDSIVAPLDVILIDTSYKHVEAKLFSPSPSNFALLVANGSVYGDNILNIKTPNPGILVPTIVGLVDEAQRDVTTIFIKASEIYMSGIVSGQGLSLNELSKISKSASSVTLQRITGTDGVDRMVCHDETKFHAIVTNAIMAANDGATAFIGFKEEPGIAEPTPSDMGPSILSVYFSPLQRRFMV